MVIALQAEQMEATHITIQDPTLRPCWMTRSYRGPVSNLLTCSLIQATRATGALSQIDGIFFGIQGPQTIGNDGMLVFNFFLS